METAMADLFNFSRTAAIKIHFLKRVSFDVFLKFTNFLKF